MIRQINKTVSLLCRHLVLITSSFAISAFSDAAVFDCISEPGYCVGVGDTVVFKYAGTTDTVGLFGTLTVNGDSIVASTPNFLAESLNGAGAVSVSDNGGIQVIAKSGYQIGSVSISENGSYLMSGSVAVDVDGLFEVYDQNDFFGPSIQQNLSISGDLTIIDEIVHIWTGMTNFDLTGPTWDDVNHIGIILQNNLNATSLAQDDIAWIKKNPDGGIELTVTTTAVPVPAAVWLFVSGFIGLINLARRRKI